MAKPKAPRWLTEAFRDGVDERENGGPDRPRIHRPPAYPGANGYCWLAQHDERRRPCSWRLERAHLIPRQRIENAMGALLPDAAGVIYGIPQRPLGPTAPVEERKWGVFPTSELILLAAWDPRIGVIGCEAHHRRLDSHATPELRIHAAALPEHAVEFIFDWGLESEAERRFDNFIRY